MHTTIDQMTGKETSVPGKGRDFYDLESLFEESFQNIREGNVVEGMVVDIENDVALIDIGYKSEGKVPLSEFMDTNGEPTVKVGDRVDVLLVRKEDKEARPILSREKAARGKAWERGRKAYESEDTVRGKIIERIKGGFRVDIGLNAFLPGSHLDLSWISDFDTWVGGKHDFKVMGYNRKRGNILLSRKKVLEEEREKQKKETLARLETGVVMEGTVKHITNYGLFVDLGGVDGLVHISNISWVKIKHPSQKHRVGDKVTVKVLDIDEERERISLGIKQLEPNPWDRIEEHFPVGTVIEGRINNITEFGLFIGMDEGIDGLVHISEISWGKLWKNPSEIYKKGDVLQAVVLSIDRDNERISLGIKQLTPDPWEEVPEKCKPGTLVSGRVVRTTSFGLFIEIEEGVEGLIHRSELPQAKRGDLAAYNPGDAVKAEVIDVSKVKRQINLSMRHIEEDTWKKMSTNLGKLFKEEMGDGAALDSSH